MSFEFTLTIVYFAAQVIFALPIGFVLISTVLFYCFVAGVDMSLAAEQIIYSSLENTIVIAIPLFIFTAKVMDLGGISERLLRFSLALVGHRKGGLAQVNIVSSVIFSGMSGDATSDVSGIGQVLINMMREKNRYPPAYAAAVTVASSCVGPVIPPSIPMLVYAFFSGVSAGALFLGGILPGLLIGAFLMVLVAFQARKRRFPTEARLTFIEVVHATIRGIGPLMMPVILLGGIYSGIFTPTEAAAAAAAYAILISYVVYRLANWATLFDALLDSARQSGMVFLLITGGMALNYVFTIEAVTDAITDFVVSLEISKLGLLFLLNLLFIVMGMFLTKAPMMYIVIPALLPALKAADIDLLHFGVMIIINMMVSMITPPMGLLVFIVSGLTKIPIAGIFKESLPFIATLFAALALITLFPPIVTFIPSLMN